MKYIALLIVLGFMGWTWSLAQTEREYGLDESRAVEQQIQEIITGYILESRPAAKNIRFLQLFSEVIEAAREMRVHVRYTFEESADNDNENEITELMFQGIVTLRSPDGRTWQMAGQDMRGPVVEFKNGVRVNR